MKAEKELSAIGGEQTLFIQPTNHPLITHLSPTFGSHLDAIRKYAAMVVLMLFIGVGQMWADATLVVGCAANNSNNYTVKLGVQAKDWSWQGIDMTKAGPLTFEGKKLYVTSYKTQDSKIIGEMKFMLYDGSDWKAETVPLSSWNESTDFHTNEIWNYDGSAWYSKMSMSQSKVYFDASNWSQTDIYMVIAHANYQGYYAMTNVANTKLYYTNAAIDWSDAMGVGVVGRSSYVTSGAHWINDISSHGGEYTGLNHYQLNNNGASAAYLIVNNGASGQQPTNDYNASYTTLLNSTQTIKSYVSTDNGSTYSNANSKATITITSFAMSSQGTSGATSSNGSLSTSAKSTTVSSARTATTTLSVGAVADGFVFVGWYNSSDQLLSSSTSYTYYPTGATEIRARFKNEISHTVTISNYCTTTSTTISSSSRGIGETTAVSITAPDLYGYTFSSWTLGDGVADQGSDLTANPISVKTLSTGTYTMRANYTEELETSPWYVAGESSAIFGGWGSSGRKMVRKTGHSAEKVFYYTIDATKVINGDVSDSDLEFKIYNSTADAYRAGADGYWITRSNTNTDVSTSNTSNMQFRPDAYGTYEFKLDCESPYSETTPHLTVTFNTKRKVTFGKRTGGNTVTAKYKNSISMTSQQYVIDGSSVTFAQTANTGYTFEGWYNASSGGTRQSTSSSYTKTVSGGDVTMYSNYTINTHSITHSASTNGSYTIKVGDAAAVSTNTTSDYGKTITLTASASTGYHFTTWSVAKSPSGTVTPSPNVTTTPATFSMPDANVTVGATFAANNYTITLNNHDATTAGTTSVSVTYNATTGLTSDITCPEKTGYTFGGYYTGEDGSGTQLISAAGKWQKNNAWINSSGQWVNDGSVTLHAKWTANNYTVTFDYTTNGGTIGELNGATNTAGVVTKSVTFGSAYGALPTATKLAKGFVGWFTTANDDSETGTRVTAETIVSTASAHTLYARFEDTYEVTVAYKCGEVTLYPSTKVTASASSLTPEITALEILGYEFSNWTGTNVTPASSTSATTTITATASTTITANYTAVPTVYFKNNLGWENVYVTFDCDFNSSKENVPANDGKPYFKMTQLGTSDIYYCAIPETYTASNYSGWAWNIAFDNTNMGSTAETTHTGTWDAFCGGEFLGRGDFDPKATMFIPYSEDFETRNSGKCYTTGCWMKYNSTDPGYKIYANTYVEGSGSAVSGTPVLLTADVAGGFEFKAKVNFTSSNYTYGFMLGKEAEKNTKEDLWYSNGGTITSETNTLPWHFATKVDGNAVTNTGKRCGLKTEATGEYEFTVSFGTGRPVVDVTYPVSTGDYRLVYKDRATWSNGAHDASWNHPSRVIKAKANAEDIVSFYVSKADGANASIKLHKCTSIDGSGNPVWDAGTAVDLSGISETGIYNFKVTQNKSKVATVTFDGGYTGNFYIRTNASDGGWSNYKTSGKNTMTYSEYAESQTADKRFSHYFMRYVNAGTNIKFCIANDYSECISDTLVSDDYTNEWLEANANIRFMWYHATNKISRAYLSGSTIVSDRFLVLEGDEKMFDANENALNISGLNANEINFSDDQNWIYETTVTAKPLARIKLTAKFADKIQYFYGTEGARTNETTEELIGGSGTDKYMLRVVYDFKTNRLIKAFMPSGTISSAQAINTDLMIIREHQGDAQQVSFSEGGKLSEVKTVYGAMKFNKWTVNNKLKADGHAAAGLSAYARDLFWISFPFDVKLGEVFGFGTYGTHWIIEYYDGKGRAANGFWADSPSNWKFVTPQMRSTFTLNANEGYVLALALDELEESSAVWNNGVEDVYLYFPSSATVSDIQSTNKKIDIDQEGYECTINRPTPDGNRTIKDSYWHVIGVPSYANYNSGLTDIKDGTPIDWTSSSLPFLYEWNPNTNAVTITSSANFAFQAMHSYLVQYAGASIYWSAINATPAPASVAARTKKQADYNLTLSLMDGENKADHTMIRLTEDENVSHAFEFNYDLCKENNKNCNNIWTVTTDGLPVAGNSMPFSTQTISIPVGVLIANAGEYTFSIPDGTEGVGVTLIDNVAETRTNLALTDYTVSLEKGTFDNRFTLEISPIQNSPTDIDNVQSDNLQGTKARKVMIDGILYIVRDGKIFDARGTRVE